MTAADDVHPLPAPVSQYPPAMKRSILGRTGVESSTVALGTWGHGGPNEADGTPIGWSGHDDTAAIEAILHAHHNGINHWDTADVYGDGNAERLIGTVLSEVPREDIFLATKVGWSRGRFDHYYHPQLIRECIERSLELLQTDYIDLYYFHHCDFGEDDRYLDDALPVMQRLREKGYFRFLGLSDWNSANIMRVIDRIDPDVVQPFRNVIDDDYASSGLKRYVDEHHLGVAFFSPLKHGLLLGKYDQPASFPPGDFRSRISEFSDPEALERIKRAVEAVRRRFADHPEPVLHALVGSLLSDSSTGCVLLGQRNARQAEAAARIGDALSLEDAEWVRSVYGKG